MVEKVDVAKTCNRRRKSRLRWSKCVTVVEKQGGSCQSVKTVVEHLVDEIASAKSGSELETLWLRALNWQLAAPLGNGKHARDRASIRGAAPMNGAG